MFIGAMIMGPVGGYLVKKFDEATEEKVPPGFELLVNNFSAGIIIVVLAIGGVLGIGPVVSAISDAMGAGVDALAANRLLPLAAFFIEPAKVLFLNNAINIGVLAPLGAEQALETGRSVLFMLETNPGPGLGLLAAYFVAGKGLAKATAPGAMIIHFLGGIHEIYFPYVLAHPIMIVAMWAGGLSANFWSVVTGAGLVATPSPGSIFAYLAVTPSGQFFNVIMHVVIGAAVSFVVGMLILRAFPARDMGSEDEGASDGNVASVPGLS
jgi:PTS system mannitol-specific IIC component